MSQPRLVLVTGASGSVGRALVPELVDHYQLRLQTRATPVASPGGAHETVTGDIEKVADVRAMVRGAEAIVHLAGESKSGASWEDVRGPNIDGAWNIFAAARAAGVRRIVFASTNHVM